MSKYYGSRFSSNRTGSSYMKDASRTKDQASYNLKGYLEPLVSNKDQMDIERIQKITQSIGKNEVKQFSATIPDNLTIEYAKALNERQLIAVTTIDGPILVIAGAGSGKTRTIIYRVSYLLENQIPPYRILLLTFTRKAANEMIHRTSTLLKSAEANKVMGGTFHSFANFILRKYSTLLQIPPNFSIMDTSDSEDTITFVMKDIKFTKQTKSFPKKNTIYKIISAARNHNLPIKKLIQSDETLEYLLEYASVFETIQQKYAEYKKQNQVYDYDDLLEKLRDYMRSNPEFLERLQHQYQYIMVDEYQDTNLLQKEIVDLLAGNHRNIMVVGDDAQSIYSFRGAKLENILEFPAMYPDCKVIKLEQNYRSQSSLLLFSNSILANAKMGYKKTLFSAINPINKPTINTHLMSQFEEAQYIVNKIKEMIDEKVPMHEIAVLYRAGFHKNFIETQLINKHLPYVVYGGIKFIERRHIKDMIAYLRIYFNPKDSIAWHRILKLIPGVGDMTIKSILDALNAESTITFSAFSTKKFYQELKKLEDVFTEIQKEPLTIGAIIEKLKDYYVPILTLLEPDFEQRIKELDFFIQFSKQYEDLEKFLTDLMLDPPSNQYKDSSVPLLDEAVRPLVLSTIHSSKGLEWDTVFIPHLLEGLFPASRSVTDIKQLEEERRLFYVACTRAKTNLFLTFPGFVEMYQEFYNKPSRFLSEVDEKSYELEKTW